MPLDPSIPGLALRGMNQVQPLDIQEAMVQRDRQRLIQAQTEKAQREATDQQRLQQLAQQFGDDPDRLASELDHVDPMLGQKYRGAVWDTRQKVASTYLEQSKARQSELSEAIDDLHMATPENWDTFVPEFLKKHPAMSPVLSGQPYNPALIDHISTAAMTEAQRVEAKRQASKQLMDKDTVGFVANMIASAETPQQQAENAKLFPMLGVTPIANRFQTKEDAQAYLEKQAKAAPSTAAKVGTFEDYVVRTYGPDPTPAQILAARKAYGQADDRAVKVSVNAGGTAAGGLSTGEGGGLELAGTWARLGQRVPIGLTRGANPVAIANEAARQNKLLGRTPVQAMLKSAMLKSDQKALDQITKSAAGAEAYESKALAQLDIVDGLSDKVWRTKSPMVNAAINAGQTQILGDDDAQLLLNAILTASTEYAKIMSGGTGSAAASSDSAQAEAKKLLHMGMGQGTLKKATALMRQEMALTMNGYDVAKQHINENMNSAAGGQTPAVADPLTVTAPNGKVYKFTSPEKAAAFKKAAGIQ